ncbi:MAG: hypothetical protein AAF363_20020 [Bacteroidota bacterium]
MRFIYLLFLATSLCTIGFSQIQQGAILIGGNLSYNGQNSSTEFFSNNTFNTSDIKTNMVTIRPQIGFFTSNNDLLGISINYEYNFLEQTQTFGDQSFSTEEKTNVILFEIF